MKTLVVYYSRTGNAQKLADVLASAMNADTEQLVDVHPFTGPIGYLRGGFVSLRKSITHICPPRFQPREYDRVVLVTPIWAGRAAPAMRSYLDQYGDMCKQLLLFTVSKGSGVHAVSDELQTTFGLTIDNAVGFLEAQIKSGEVLEQLKTMSGRM